VVSRVCGILKNSLALLLPYYIKGKEQAQHVSSDERPVSRKDTRYRTKELTNSYTRLTVPLPGQPKTCLGRKQR